MGAAAAGQHHASSAGSSHAPSAVQHGQRSALHAAQPPRLGVLLFALLAWGSACGLGGAVIMDGSAESIHRLLAQFEHDVAALPPREHASQTLSLPGADGRTATGAEGQGATRSKRPNIVLVLSDDQDLLLNSTHAAYMPALHELLAKEGLWLRSFAVSSSVCCPSRVNLLTGQFTHNTNISSNVAPMGGYVKFQNQSMDESYLPVWLQQLGYRTYFTGKFLNGFNPAKDPTQRCPNGWTTFEPLVKPYIMHYWDTSFTVNCGPVKILPNQYSTDVLLKNTLGYLMDALEHPEQPFYIHVNPVAPHESCGPRENVTDGDSCNNMPMPATRHMHLYHDVQVPRPPNFGRVPPKGTFNWVDVNTPQRGWKPVRMRDLYRQRLRAVRAVDEMLAVIVRALEVSGQLDNTYVIFMSDNGFKVGNQGVYKGKLTAYEEDVRVPFFIRGPGIAKAVVSDYQGTMCDVPASILDLAGGVAPPHVDGTPLPLKRLVGFTPMRFSADLPGAAEGSVVQGRGQLAEPRDQIPHEMWVWGSDKRLTGKAYRALRVCTTHLAFGGAAVYRRAAQSEHATFGFRLWGTVSYFFPRDGLDRDAPVTCYKYVVWCTGTVELYDLMLDPRETLNRAAAAPASLLSRLEAYLTVQGFCRGKHCYSPYSLLHPEGGVATFAQAMEARHDGVYAALPPFRFKQCQRWHFPENEQGWLSYAAGAGADQDRVGEARIGGRSAGDGIRSSSAASGQQHVQVATQASGSGGASAAA